MYVCMYVQGSMGEIISTAFAGVWSSVVGDNAQVLQSPQLSDVRQHIPCAGDVEEIHLQRGDMDFLGQKRTHQASDGKASIGPWGKYIYENLNQVTVGDRHNSATVSVFGYSEFE